MSEALTSYQNYNKKGKRHFVHYHVHIMFSSFYFLLGISKLFTQRGGTRVSQELRPAFQSRQTLFFEHRSRDGQEVSRLLQHRTVDR